MAHNSVLSQTFIQHLGKMRDERGIALIREKLATLGPEDRSLPSPWNQTEKPLELLCLEAIAKIGGQEATAIINNYRNDPAKDYLAAEIDKLDIADLPIKNVAPPPDDYPDILNNVKSIHALLGGGGCASSYTPDQKKSIVAAWRKLQWPGPIEYLSGDGQTTTFKLRNKITDHIHDISDPFSDFGIFISKPKVEYPLGTWRWADSHTFLGYQVADGTLYAEEYTWAI
ncbi:MAG: hypothetical protein L3J79_12680, partial [Candidatus Marinimicrobia bacterium]|nr:hypothetical protein [Candidatus Neomarinimicrobiota bacterium]